MRLTDLPSETLAYFKKLSGYDTLRVVLAEWIILVEGPSDELVIQRAFKDRHSMLPLEAGVDVINVRGLSFKRFLDIAKPLGKRVDVITDKEEVPGSSPGSPTSPLQGFSKSPLAGALQKGTRRGRLASRCSRRLGEEVRARSATRPSVFARDQMRREEKPECSLAPSASCEGPATRLRADQKTKTGLIVDPVAASATAVSMSSKS
jgi:hypothetical protein